MTKATITSNVKLMLKKTSFFFWCVCVCGYIQIKNVNIKSWVESYVTHNVN